MHQVLGKRVDTPPPRELNQPVKPIAPADAPKALHSDSRLDSRGSSASLNEITRALRAPLNTPAGLRPGGDTPSASTQTHFTPTARTIADLLIRFPAPPSVVRLPQPLIPAGDSVPPAQVAERLQVSVRDSGLFYESHVARWYRGELPREQLQREPQMWRTQTFVPTPPAAVREALAPLQVKLALTPSSGDMASTRALLPAGDTVGRGGLGTPASASPSAAPLASGAGMPAAPSPGALGGAAGGEAREAGMPAPGATPPTSDSAQPLRLAQEPLHESLQGLVRHQLEMLVTPVLRWEGDVWSGVFMALVMHLPQVEREGRESQDEEAARKERERQGWRSTMTLQVAGLGEVGVDLWLRGSRLDLDLAADDAAVRESLEQGVDRLTPRLEACGLADVRVRVAQGEEAR